MKLKIAACLLATVLAIMLLTPPASAAESAQTTLLNDLQRIASRAGSYRPAGKAEPATARDQQAPNTLDPYGCTLYPSVVHFRMSSGRRSVGAKPYTTCTAGAPAIISQTSTLYIVEWAGLYYRTMVATTATSRGVRSLTQQNLEWFCVNSNSSRFQQETKGYSVQAGGTYQSAVITPTVDLTCGY